MAELKNNSDLMGKCLVDALEDFVQLDWFIPAGYQGDAGDENDYKGQQ